MVLTASYRSRVIADQLGAYCASKAAVEMLISTCGRLGNYAINVKRHIAGASSRPA